MELQFLLAVPEFASEFDVYSSTPCHPTVENFENHMRLSGPRNSGQVTLSGTKERSRNEMRPVFLLLLLRY